MEIGVVRNGQFIHSTYVGLMKHWLWVFWSMLKEITWKLLLMGHLFI